MTKIPDDPFVTLFEDVFGDLFPQQRKHANQKQAADYISLRYFKDEKRRWRWQLCDKENNKPFLISVRFWYAKEDCIANCHLWVGRMGFIIDQKPSPS